ncbi:TonB-dependent receptor [Flavobacterium granuli]|uniref:Outer membrane receptor for ferrienterochelin and colicins n=1 Tax=Flavobacterium granuli TaxID=280093 RepID=A0A1M5K6G0_9FLAO|nr:TonB-dependent receptor [Flavobacterium granuli]PRZ26174.1 outer membrane receptor for ferrienterochelin and colicins [Flavobacterium granuli]SHG48160.1 outer membrane receptor for ferrienterochelin and colicins [Flavobacterium granuli]
MRNLILLFFIQITIASFAQTSIKGKVSSDGMPLQHANIVLKNTKKTTITNQEGDFVFTGLNIGHYEIIASYAGLKSLTKTIMVNDTTTIVLDFDLKENNTLDEVVITGTLKPVSRIESPVPVEVYKPTFFKKNPTANIFEALQNVNGVRPQLNCNVCNTGDIHINGLEGPYTLVLIDGMPIVSGLSTVYGLSGIPNSLLERIEIVKGPASSLYGSEAVGGLINIITKNPKNAPLFSADSFLTDWGELNVDLGFKTNIGKTASLLTGINYFNYSNPIDNNNDNFTDLTLQDRISVFQKWNFNRKNNKLFSLAGRYFYEDRWGGELQWQKKNRGGNEVYGESIYTKRWELLGAYELPIAEKMLFSFSYTDHDQNSVYGEIPYLAKQRIGFGQLTWDKKMNNHDLLFGTALRYQYYDDNTAATLKEDINWIPSLFIQDEITFNDAHKLLLGARYDYNSNHGSIFTPRMAYKWKINDNNILRFNTGTGFRIVNLFTEEHAALTGSRDVIVLEELKPERSYNVNLNYLKKIYTHNGNFIGLETTAWYTHFTNSIIPDYDSNPNQIIYRNLDGYAVTKGISTNADFVFNNGLKMILGATYMDVSKTEHNITTRQILTEKFSATWAISYRINNLFLDVDYTGNAYGPMRLPLLGNLDPRKEYSPTWSIQNIQFTFNKLKNIEIYGGVKNLLNWTPNKGNPFIIARANDPFDKNVQYDNNGNVKTTPDNPYALSFDPSYVYGPNQGIRSFFGLRYTLK